MRIAVVDMFVYTVAYDEAFCAGLAHQGHDVVMIGRPLGRPWPAASGTQREFPFTEDRIFRAGNSITKAFRYARMLLALRREIKAVKPDVVHFQWLHYPIIDFIFLLTLKPCVLAFTLHDRTIGNGDRMARARTIGFDKLLSRFDVLFAHVVESVDFLERRKAPSALVVLVRPGLRPVEGFERRPAPAAKPFFTFLLFGKIRPYKGIDILIEAASRLSEEAKARVRFRIVGKSDMDLSVLRDQAESLSVGPLFEYEDRFIPDSELGSLFTEADGFAFPYRAIDSSGVLMLVIQCAKPILASNVGIFGELFGDSGLVFDIQDIPALTGIIERIVLDESFRRYAIDKVNDALAAIPGWDSIAQDTIKAYEKFLPS